jgi:DNA polymerase
LFFDSIPEVLSRLIRTAFIPDKDCRFIISDFSAIEARVIAWLAGERWRMEVFNSQGRIYEESAAKMFNVPVESIDKSSPLRQKGKIAELALGYQGSRGALIAMGALKMGLKEEELPKLVAVWRNSNQRIVRLWKDVEAAAVTAVRKSIPIKMQYGIEFYVRSGILFIRLPSGRCLSYLNPRLENDGTFNKQVLTYEGAMKDTKKWGRLKTYGGKLVENIVQGIARDCLCATMMRLTDRGYRIVMHVHDEVVLEVPYGFGTVEEVENIMAMDIPWAEGLVLKGDCLEGEYYCK